MNRQERSHGTGPARIAIGLVTALCAVACNVNAGEPAEPTKYHVNVRMSAGVGVGVRAPLLWESQATASAIFAKIGVQLTWRYARRRPGPKTVTSCAGHSATHDLIVEIVPEAPAKNGGNALAEASLNTNSGAHIVIFFDRVESMLKRQRAPQATILGYVLAHEIAHALQGVARHSETGVMRANWTTDDFERMGMDGLQFTDEDAQLIRLGLTRPDALPGCSEVPSGKL